MKKNKNKLAWMLILTLILSFLPINVASSTSDDLNIVSTTNITVDSAKNWAKERGATQTFINLADLYWKYAASHGGVNPGVAYVQAAKETGYGKFGGVINESYNNPCGLKTNKGGNDSDPNAHMKFSNWDEGVQAHLDHLALYAGANGYPRQNTYDPRHFASIKGSASTVVSLGGKWAPSSTYGTELLGMYRQLEYNDINKNMYANIEEPAENSTVYGETLNVSGWALSPAGVDRINVYIDGILQGNATIGQSRPDVQRVFPSYLGASNSGFSMKLNVNNLSAGIKELKVVVIGKDGKTNIVTTKFNIEKVCSVQNVDTPSNGAIITGNIIDVSGWSLAGCDIKNINFYIDNTLIGSTNVGITREDVGKIYSYYPNANKSGFSKRLDISKISNGDKILRVEQVKNTNATYSSEVKIKINKLSPITTLEVPKNNQLIDGDSMEIEGWALNGSRVKTINIYVDDVLVKTTTTGRERLDVNNAYPNFKDKNSGFKEVIDVTSLSGGNKILKIEQIGEDGTSDVHESLITINKLVSISNIESPAYNSQVKGNKINLSGWAISDSGVSEVKAYIDGKEVGSGKVGIERKDVKNAYPNYNNANKSGFSIDLDISKCKAEEQIIEVVEISNDGSIYKDFVRITISKPNPITTIDIPYVNSKIKGDSLSLQGWALNYSGVKAINIYIGNELVKTITTGMERADVMKIYPQFNDKNSGFETTIDISKLNAGYKNIVVEQIGKDDSKDYYSRKIYIDKLEAKSNIETPTSGSNINSKEINVEGWAISDSGVKEVQVYVDGKEKGKTQVNLAREDLKAVFSNYPNVTKAGFSLKININDIAPGNKEIKIKEISNNGSEHWNSVRVNIVKKSPITVVDAPINGYIEKNDTLNISGWALNPSGVKVVKVYVDGKEVGSTKVTVARQDVVNVYPGYQTTNVCGYETSIVLAGLLFGRHEVRVDAIGVDGTISSEAKEIFYKEKPSKLVVVDPGHNYGGDDGAYATVNGIKYCERDLNMAIAIKTKVALEDKGYRVVLTRKLGDREVLSEKESLSNRVNIANSLNADLFISIHENKFEQESACGTEVYYSTNNNDNKFPQSPNKAVKIETSKSLATRVVNNVSKVGFRNRGAKDGNLFVLRNTMMPSILVECGFISNLGDVTKLSNSSIQNQIAVAISNGVYNNF